MLNESHKPIEKEKIKELIKHMRKKQNELNLKKNNGFGVYLYVGCILPTIKREHVEINPFRFNLKTGYCEGLDIFTNEFIKGVFW